MLKQLQSLISDLPQLYKVPVLGIRNFLWALQSIIALPCRTLKRRFPWAQILRVLVSMTNILTNSARPI